MFGWGCLAALASLMYISNFVIRAQAFAYPLFALTVWLIVTDARAARLRARTWLAVPVLVIWANTHGSVLVGAALAALYAGWRAAALLRRGDRRPALAYLALGAAAAACVVATPYGTGVLGYYRQISAATPALTRYELEWQPVSPLHLVSIGFFALLGATMIAVAVAWRRGTRPDPLLATIAVATLTLTLIAVRNEPFFAFAGSLLAADTLARSRNGIAPALSPTFSRVTAAALTVAALASAASIATRTSGQFEGAVAVRAINATAALAARAPAARILADDWSSAALLWLHPALFARVAYDARLEQYTLAQLNAYATFINARQQGWQHLARGYNIIVASRRHHQPLATALTRLPGWHVSYSGPDGVVLRRSLPA
jgi:hypothetical protein